MTKVSIIVVNFNLKDTILGCLASVAKLNQPTCEITPIIVDNASKDESARAIKAAYPNVTYIQNTDNAGYTGGNNAGMRYALDHGAEYVLVLNPDVTVDTELVEELLKGFTDENIGITVPKIYFSAGFEFHKDRYKEEEKGKVIWYAGGIMDWDNMIGHHKGVDEVDHGQFNTAEDTEYATGNCFMVKREVLERVGLLDDRYFMYYEDADFSMRVKRAGYRIRYIPSAFLWHQNAAASGGSGNPLQDYFITRNRLLFGFNYARARTKFALVRESVRYLFQSKIRRMGVMDFYLHRFGKGSYIK